MSQVSQTLFDSENRSDIRFLRQSSSRNKCLSLPRGITPIDANARKNKYYNSPEPSFGFRFASFAPLAAQNADSPRQAIQGDWNPVSSALPDTSRQKRCSLRPRLFHNRRLPTNEQRIEQATNSRDSWQKHKTRPSLHSSQNGPPQTSQEQNQQNREMLKTQPTSLRNHPTCRSQHRNADQSLLYCFLQKGPRSRSGAAPITAGGLMPLRFAIEIDDPETHVWIQRPAAKPVFLEIEFALRIRPGPRRNLEDNPPNPNPAKLKPIPREESAAERSIQRSTVCSQSLHARPTTPPTPASDSGSFGTLSNILASRTKFCRRILANEFCPSEVDVVNHVRPVPSDSPHCTNHKLGSRLKKQLRTRKGFAHSATINGPRVGCERTQKSAPVNVNGQFQPTDSADAILNHRRPSLFFSKRIGTQISNRFQLGPTQHSDCG